MKEIFIVLGGGGLGSVARYLVNLNVTRAMALRFPDWPVFPFGVMLINVTGSFLMGLVAGLFATRFDAFSQDMRLFLATGILGGYTTFSAFSLDVANLIERGDVVLAFAYVAGSVILSVLGLFIGLWMMRAII